VLTRTNTLGDVATQQQQTTTEGEYLVRQQTLGQLPHVLHTIMTEVTTDQQPTDKLDQEKRHSTGRTHSDSHPTIATQFSRQFEFGEAAEAGDGGLQEEMQTGLHSAWSQDAIKHQESRADHVLVETTRGFSDAEQYRRSDIEELEWGAAELTRDAFQVAIQRVSAPEPVPLSPGAISAAEFITLDILNHALGDDLKADRSASQCGPDQIKLSLALVRRVLASASSTKWPEAVVKAASLLVDDVLSMALRVSRGANVVAEPDHVWSRDAIQACCLIVRDLMADATRQVSTALTKQQATPVHQQPTTAYQHSQDDHVRVEVDADRQDILPHVPPPASQPAAVTTVKQTATPKAAKDSQEAVLRGPEFQVSTALVKQQVRPAQQESPIAYRQSQHDLVDVDFEPDRHDILEHVSPRASQPAAVTTVKQPAMPRDSQEAVSRGQDIATDTRDITKQPRPPSRALADSPGQQLSATVDSRDGHPVKLNPAAEPQPRPAVGLQPTSSRPPSEIPSACSIFSDSTNASEFTL